MKNFDYIEHVINDPVTGRIKLRFIARLINDAALRKQYRRYLILTEEVEKQENIVRDVLRELRGFNFNINDAVNIHDMQGIPADDLRTAEDSRIIRSVIEANRPPKPGKKNGWFKAAAVLSMGLMIITSVLTSEMAAFQRCDFTLEVF
jgi:hypothetical protein